MMKGTPCSRGNCARLKTSPKARISIEVQGLGPAAGIGAAPQPYFASAGNSSGRPVRPIRSTNPAERVRAWLTTPATEATARRPGSISGACSHPRSLAMVKAGLRTCLMTNAFSE